MRQKKTIVEIIPAARSEIGSFFTTVIDELRGLYASVTHRVKEAIDASLFFRPVLLDAQDQVRLDVQEITEIAMARGVRVRLGMGGEA